MFLEILSYPDPRLRQISRPVDEITPEIRELAANMLETMYQAKGVGLAAPQIGKNMRLIVMDAAQNDDKNEPRVLVNPVLELSGEEVTSELEGCLSVPMNFRADVQRSSVVRVRARDLDGNEIDEVLEGFPAIVVQHEVDHLDGKLFIDRMSHLRRSLYDNKVKKWLKRKEAE